MTYEFKCEETGLIVVKAFPTIRTAIAHFESPENTDSFDEVTCPDCGGIAHRIYGNAGTTFYGTGWDKPAPSGKQSTVGSDPTKAVKSMGPPTNNSFLGRR